jgi:hypothetical protein
MGTSWTDPGERPVPPPAGGGGEQARLVRTPGRNEPVPAESLGTSVPAAGIRHAPPLALELLVHGVGGTTPRLMLGDPHTVRVCGDETAGMYRRAADEHAERDPAKYAGRTITEGYCWSNLTSGKASRALWLLLLPFMVVNLAHWMRPTSAHRHPRLDHAYDLLVRLAALSLTVLFVAAAGEVSMDLLAWQCTGLAGCSGHRSWLGFLAAGRGGWWSLPGRRLAVAAAVPAGLTGLLWWLSHRTWSTYESQRPPLPGDLPGVTPAAGDGRAAAGHTDPGGGGPGERPRHRPALSLPGFWYGRRLVARMRAAHTAAGLLTVGAALLLPTLRHDRAASGAVLQGVGWALAAVLAALAVAVLLVVDRSGRSEETADDAVDRYGVRVLPGLALAATALTALYAGWHRAGWHSAGRLPGGDVFTGTAIAQGAVVVLLAAVAWLMHRDRPGPRTILGGLGGPAVAMIACAVGGLMSAGTAVRFADWIDGGSTPGAPHDALSGPPVVLIWQATVIPPMIVALLVLVAVLAVQYLRDAARQAERVRRSHPGEVEQPARTRQIARAAARARLTDRAPALVATCALASLALGAVAVAGAMASGETPGDAARGTASFVSALAQSSQALGSWLIGAAVLLLVGLGRRAYQHAGARRTIGILWDVGTFWPRAAHPFAPPCYAERAVPDLTWRMATWTGSAGRELVLSGHSQGSVLAAAAVWQLDAETRGRVALLTYGSPLERLYGRYFPAYLGPAALTELGTELHAWTNLYRLTDPIGGPIRLSTTPGHPSVDAPPLQDPAAYGRTRTHPLPAPILAHHDYPADPHFTKARTALLTRLLPSGKPTPQPTEAIAPPQENHRPGE